MNHKTRDISFMYPTDNDCTVSCDPKDRMQVKGCEVKVIQRSTSNRSGQAGSVDGKERGPRKLRSWNAHQSAAVSRKPSSWAAGSRHVVGFSWSTFMIVVNWHASSETNVQSFVALNAVSCDIRSCVFVSLVYPF